MAYAFTGTCCLWIKGIVFPHCAIILQRNSFVNRFFEIFLKVFDKFSKTWGGTYVPPRVLLVFVVLYDVFCELYKALSDPEGVYNLEICLKRHKNAEELVDVMKLAQIFISSFL